MLASLCGQRSLGFITVSLALSILLVRVLYGDLLVHEILPVHVRDRRIRRLKVAKRDEPITLGQIVVIPCNLATISDCFKKTRTGAG